MSGNLRVTHAELKSLEGEIERVSTSMTQQVQKLANVITQLEADWKGIAANAYREQQQMLNDDHDQLRRILDGIKEAVRDTKLSSEANEDEVLQDLRGISGISQL